MDQIANLLIRIKNASAVRRYEFETPYSKIKDAILTILKNEGFIRDFEVTEVLNKKSLRISISPVKPPIHLKRLSKPGRRYYVGSNEIPKPLRGLGTIIISTPMGVITGREAAKKGVGGELICEVW